MIVGVGCDIVDHAHTKKMGWDVKVDRLSRIFTQSEIDLMAADKVRFLSGRFAAKEAVLKSLGTYMTDGISLTDIVILQEPNGKPNVKLLGELKQYADHIKVQRIHLSISHTPTYSIAYAISESLAEEGRI